MGDCHILDVRSSLGVAVRVSYGPQNRLGAGVGRGAAAVASALPDPAAHPIGRVSTGESPR
jgi:hypothetical protein